LTGVLKGTVAASYIKNFQNPRLTGFGGVFSESIFEFGVGLGIAAKGDPLAPLYPEHINTELEPNTLPQAKRAKEKNYEGVGWIALCGIAVLLYLLMGEVHPLILIVVYIFLVMVPVAYYGFKKVC
jgi:hypothetical protein